MSATPRTGITNQTTEMKRSIATLFIIFCLIPISQAQSHKVKVCDDDGNPIPFIHAVSAATGKYVMTDQDGFFSYTEEMFPEDDSLCFRSLFYQPKHEKISNLKAKGEIRLSIHVIPAVTVTPVNPYEAIEKASKHFGRNYDKNYCAKVFHLNTVECNGKYREFEGYYGLYGSFDFNQKAVNKYFNDPNFFKCFAPLTVMKTDALNPDDNGILSTNRMISGTRNKYERLKDSYQNHRRHWPLTAQRALEIYSPLNNKQVRNFSYRIDSTYEDRHGKILVIRFENKNNTYPGKTRIFGRGYIHCEKETGQVIKVIAENMQDQHSFLIADKLEPLAPMGTQQTLEINYGTEGNSIYTSSVSMTTVWVDVPPESRSFVYYCKEPRRLDPIGNNLVEYEYYSFSDFRSVDDKTVRDIKNVFRTQSDKLDTYAPYDKSFWETADLTGIDRQKLIRDLTQHGRSLNQQAEANAFKEGEDWHSLSQGQKEFYRNYHIYTKERLLPMIYGQ